MWDHTIERSGVPKNTPSTLLPYGVSISPIAGEIRKGSAVATQIRNLRVHNSSAYFLFIYLKVCEIRKWGTALLGSFMSRLSVTNSLKRILPGDQSRGFMAIVGGSAVAQVISFAVSPVLTRLYSPKDFGVVAVFSSILALTIVCSLRYELAIPIARDEEEVANIAGIAFVALLGTTVLTFFCLLGLDHFGRGLLHLSGALMRVELVFIPLGMVGMGAYQVLSYFFIRQKSYTLLGGSKLRRNLWQAPVQILLGFMKTGPYGMIIGQIVGQGAGISTLVLAVRQSHRQVVHQLTWLGLWQAAKKYWRFPVFIGPAALINNLTLQLMPLVIGVFFGARDAGLYALSQRVIGLPMSVVGNAVSQVYLGEASRTLREHPKQMFNLYARTAWKLAVFGGIPIIGFATIASYLIRPLFGAAWSQSAVYLLYSTPTVIGAFIVTPLSQHTSLLERQDVQLVLDVLRLALLVGSIGFSRILGLSTTTTVGVASLTVFAVYCVNFAVYGKITRQFTRAQSRKPSVESELVRVDD